jgi:hypothetical protein
MVRQARVRGLALSRPNLLVRLGVSMLLAVSVAALIYAVSRINWSQASDTVFSVFQGVDAVFNMLVLLGAGALFLVTFEARLKRERALADLHELRSIVHVIDMHQLTKDPASTVALGKSTTSSPARMLGPFELARYLDYCSEMLSLCAKAAALYAQYVKDPVVMSAVTEIEQLASNLSSKIWQKIMIVQSGIIPRPTKPPEVLNDNQPLTGEVVLDPPTDK